MTTVSVLESKLSLVEEYLELSKEFSPYSKNEIKNDFIKRKALERHLYVLVQATIDLAEGIISYLKLRKPTDYGETFKILKDSKLIDLKLTEKLIKMVGFRNIIAHEYVDLNYDLLYKALTVDYKDIKTFLKRIKNKLNLR